MPALRHNGHGRCLYNIQRSVCAYVFVLLQWLVWYGDVAGTQDKDLLWGLTKSVVRIAFNLWDA